MKSLKLVAAGLLFSACAAVPAFAQAGDNEITYISPSIIMIGTPDPCDNGGCEEEMSAVEEKRDNNAALVDASGMPTSMPVIIRPSVDAPVAAAPTPTAFRPVSDPAVAQPTPAAPENAAAPTEPATPVAATQLPAPVEGEQASANENPKPEGE